MTILTHKKITNIKTQEHDTSILNPIIKNMISCSSASNITKMENLLSSLALSVSEYCRIYPGQMNVSFQVKPLEVPTIISAPYYPIINLISPQYCCKICDNQSILLQPEIANTTIVYKCGYSNYQDIPEKIKQAIQDIIYNQLNCKYKQNVFTLLEKYLKSLNPILI